MQKLSSGNLQAPYRHPTGTLQAPSGTLQAPYRHSQAPYIFTWTKEYKSDEN